jgi:ketosteroid isomerase-like protein
MAQIQGGPKGVQDALRQWVDAELKGDAARLDDLLTDDFVGVGPLGFLLSKRDWLARYEQGDFNYEALRLEEIQTRVHGDAAVVTARHIGRSFMREFEIPFTDLRVTLVLVDRSDNWRLAGVQMSFIAGTPGAPPVPVPPQEEAK